MATVHHFGTDIDPSHFVEVPGTLDPDGSGNVTAPRRPAAGTILSVRDAATLAALPDITTQNYGYWDYTTTDIPQIQVSGDGGVTWVGPLTSAEAMGDVATAGANAADANASAQAAVAAVQAHGEAVDPHPQYAHFGGLTTAPRFWSRLSSQPMPTAADGAQDDDLLFYGG